MGTSIVRASVIGSLAILALLGCARVDVRKVPVRANYQTWGDSHQREADAIPGIRYYLPRPYMSVDKPFTVAGGDFIIAGSVDSAGNAITVQPCSLPPYLRKHFALVDTDAGKKAILGADSVHVSSTATAASGRLRPQSTGAGAGEAGAASALGDSEKTPDPRATAAAISANYATNPVAAPLETFSLTLTLGKGTVGEVESASSPIPTPCLVPWGSDSKPQLDKFIRLALSAAPTNYAADADGVYKASGRVAEMKHGQFYVPALLFHGRLKDEPSQPNRWILLWRSDQVLTVVNAPEPSAQPDAKPEKETSVSDEPKTSASFVAGGNPSTDPVLHVNPSVSVVMLPDFEEQYAINVQGGLGQAKSKIALENGWLLENAETAIDNRELGKFVFKQIEKFTDIAAAVLKDELLPTAAEAAGTAASGAAPQSTALEGGSSVLLRVRYIVQAQPGLYPILKPGEVERWKQVHAQFCEMGSDCCTGEGDNAVFVPCPPYTVVAKDVYRRVVVTLLSTRPKAPKSVDGGPVNGNGPTTPPAPTTLAGPARVAVIEWLGSIDNPLSSGKGTALDALGGDTGLVIQTFKPAASNDLLIRSARVASERQIIQTALVAKKSTLLANPAAPRVDTVLVESPSP